MSQAHHFIRFIVGTLSKLEIFSPTVLSILALCVAPLFFVFVMTFGHINHKTFVYAFGAQVQMIVGGIGALIHEFLHLTCALVAGHSLRNIHFQILEDFHQHTPLDNADHFWGNKGIYNTFTDEFLGTFPTLCIAMILVGIQKVFGGNPLPMTFLKSSALNYFNWHFWIHLFTGSFKAAFAIPGLALVPFLLCIIVLASDGFNVSRNERLTALSGFIPWTLLVLIIVGLMSIGGYGAWIAPYALIVFNAIILLTFRTVWYLILTLVLMLPFVIMNHYDAVVTFMKNMKTMEFLKTLKFK